MRYPAKTAVPTCPNNDAVTCRYKEKPCGTCGWNPEVKKARLNKLLTRRGSKTPIK